MARAVNVQRASQSRVFVIEDGAGPAQSPEYYGLARAGAVAWPQGDITPIRVPSRDAYEAFDEIGRIRGARGLPSMPLEVRKTRELSEILRLVRKGCPLDIQVHAGACKNPTDFNEGWELIMVLEGANATDYGTTELGALDSDQEAAVVETVPFTGIDYFEIKPLTGGSINTAALETEVLDILICDSRTCGECGLSSDGCQRVFALTKSSGVASPGSPTEVHFSEDGGNTWRQTYPSTIGLTNEANAMACVGSNLVLISEDSQSVHYAAIADILDRVETWQEVATGFVNTKGPLAIFSLGRTLTWIAAEGGYIYFSSDITSGVVVQSAGSLTVQDLKAIHGVDDFNLVAVGALNVVLSTNNGGATWTSLTGPAVGVNLNTVYMRSKLEWFVGGGNGVLYYTRDGGASWAIKGFPGSGAGAVRDIAFSGATVGYMAHNTATAGRILRTIDGGNSWYVLPEGATTIPSNDYIGALAACTEDKNLVFGGGLADNAIDGIMLKLA